MFSVKGLNKKINRIPEKSLRLVLNDRQSTSDETMTIHQQGIAHLLTKYINFEIAIPLISRMTFST